MATARKRLSELLSGNGFCTAKKIKSFFLTHCSIFVIFILQRSDAENLKSILQQEF